jgi:hypothetical protein
MTEKINIALNSMQLLVALFAIGATIYLAKKRNVL